MNTYIHTYCQTYTYTYTKVRTGAYTCMYVTYHGVNCLSTNKIHCSNVNVRQWSTPEGIVPQCIQYVGPVLGDISNSVIHSPIHNLPWEGAMRITNVQNINIHTTGIHTQILVSWLRGRSKEELCVHKPCSTGQWYSTGHQTGFIVRINWVKTRQKISKHISNTHMKSVLTMFICAVQLPIIQYTRIHLCITYGIDNVHRWILVRIYVNVHMCTMWKNNIICHHYNIVWTLSHILYIPHPAGDTAVWYAVGLTMNNESVKAVTRVSASARDWLTWTLVVFTASSPAIWARTMEASRSSCDGTEQQRIIAECRQRY